jgi:hypothetical protein
MRAILNSISESTTLGLSTEKGAVSSANTESDAPMKNIATVINLAKMPEIVAAWEVHFIGSAVYLHESLIINKYPE